MTILWCGGEDVDFPNGTLPTAQTYGPTFSSEYARYSLYSNGYTWSDSFTKQTDLWVSFMAYSAGEQYFYDGSFIGIIGDTQTNTGFWIRKLSGKTVLSKNVNGTFTDLVAEANISGIYAISKIDVHIVWGDTGTITVYFGGNLIISYTGDTRITNSTGYDKIGLLGYTLYQCVSCIIVADEDTRLMRLKTLSPSATGDSSAWAGAYTDIDEITLSDTDKIYTSTANADFQSNLTGMPTGTYSVKAVKVASRIANVDANAGIQHGVKTNGTVSLSSTVQSVGNWASKELLLTSNPVTGLPWTSAEIDALQVAYRHKEI